MIAPEETVECVSVQEAAADPLIGALLEGRYRIRAWLAVGGMSTVYAAVDERLEREVAVKVMAPGLSADPVFLDRFAREARSAARLSHVNAVAVYDQGRDGSRVFLVMELVRGRTLRDLLRERGHVSPAEALSLLEPMLAALASAHRAGLVHRDVKPENILLSDDGVVKVADFGLARAVAAEGGAMNTGLIMGTVAYSAPEQFRRGNVDMRSDVYSAGIVAFELLTGRQPHIGPDAMSVAYHHVHSDVAPPSNFQPGIAPALDHLVRRATARDPQFRPQDAGAFLGEVHDVRRELRLPILPVPRRPRLPPVESGPPTANRPGNSTLRQPRSAATAPHPGSATALPAREPDRPTPAMSERDMTAVHARVDTAVHGRDGFAPAALRMANEAHRTLISPAFALRPTPSPAAPRPRRRRRWLRTVIGALVLLLVCAGLVAGSWWFAAGRWGSVPNVHDQPVEQAQFSLQAQGFKVITDAPQADEVVAKGKAIGTRPDIGTRLVHGRTVHLLVSAGPTFYGIPTLRDKSKKDAVTALTSLVGRGVTVSYSQTSDDKVRSGDVIRTVPSEGTRVRRGDTVTVYVSTGPPILTLPDESGQTVDDATVALTTLKFAVTRKDEFSDDVAAGTVVSQDPRGPTQQRKFTAVTLTVSKGPDLVVVPTLPKLDPLDDAEAKITAAGLAWKVQTSFGGLYNLVIQLDPATGQKVHRGSTVTITVI